MAFVVDEAFGDFKARARRVPIAEVAAKRHLHLRGEGKERSGPCPMCGGGRKGLAADRFNINTDKNVFLCRQCKEDGGDVIKFVMWLDGCNFVRACETLLGEPSPRGGGAGLSPEELARRQAEREARQAEEASAVRLDSADFRELERRRLYRWWRSSHKPIRTPVEAYLALRACSLPRGARLRYSPRAKLWADGTRGAKLIHTGPAMRAAITGPDGRFAGLHTTWIDLRDPDGKARVPHPETGEFLPAKKVRGSAKRGRIELVRVAEPWHLVMGEGIETTLSVYDDEREAGTCLDGVAFWAAYSLGNLGGPAEGKVAHPTLRDRGNRPIRVAGPIPAGESIPIPDSVERLTFLRDGDSDPFLTEVTLERASRRYARPGRVIEVAEAPAGMDFNDLRRRRA